MTNLKNFDKIFVLVSGGIDSTYLYDKLKKFYKEKVYPVNCFNPFEQSKTLDQISKDPNFIQIKPEAGLNYGQILKESFLKLPEAYKLKKESRYYKKIFPCCAIIKHAAFLKDPLFQTPNTVVISGIKQGDGWRRRKFLEQLAFGSKLISQSITPNNYYFKLEGKERPTFFHLHKQGQLYAYPFRDYKYRNFPKIVLNRLYKKYP